MIKLSNILKIFGGVFLTFSMVFTFPFDIEWVTDEGDILKLDNILYFRGVLFGSLLLLVGSAITSVNTFVANILYSLALGNICVFVSSIENLINDKDLNFDFFFYLAMGAILFTFIILTIIRLWLWQRLKQKSTLVT